MTAIRRIGMHASMLPASIVSKCSYPFVADTDVSKARVSVASLCLVYSTLVSFAKEHRRDIPIEDFARSLLDGMSYSAKLCDGRSSYSSLIVSDFEHRMFRSHFAALPMTRVAIDQLFSDRLDVVPLFAGIANIRENAFRSFALGDEDGFAHRVAVGFVSSAQLWLVPDSASSVEGAAFVTSLKGHLMCEYLTTMFSMIKNA